MLTNAKLDIISAKVTVTILLGATPVVVIRATNYRLTGEIVKVRNVYFSFSETNLTFIFGLGRRLFKYFLLKQSIPALIYVYMYIYLDLSKGTR